MDLPGYQINREIYSNKNIAVFWGNRTKGASRPVIIKTLKNRTPSAKEALELAFEYELTSDLYIDGIMKPEQKDTGAIPLKQYLEILSSNLHRFSHF